MSKKNNRRHQQSGSPSASSVPKTTASPSSSMPTSKPNLSQASPSGAVAAQPKTAPLPPHLAQPRRAASSPPTLEQQRAAHALNAVRELTEAPFAKEYRSYVESLPATIVMNGLGQACATLLAAANGGGDRGHAYSALHGHLQSWLCRPASPGNANGVYSGADSLIDAIVQNGQSEYVHAQAEALAYLVWLKKFSKAFLRKD